MLHITLDLPPTTNNAYTNGRGHGRRVLTGDARAFKEAAALIARRAAAHAGWQYQPGQRLAVSLRLHFPTNRRCDIANREKLPIDAIAEALGFDDSAIDDLHLQRGPVDKERPRCEVEVRVL